MAKQTRNPGTWNDSMSDGCTGVPDWLPFVGSMIKCCRKHDKAFFYGGTYEDFLTANKKFKKCIEKAGNERCWVCGKVAFFVAKWRKWGVDRFGYEHFNQLGPGMPKDG